MTNEEFNIINNHFKINYKDLLRLACNIVHQWEEFDFEEKGHELLLSAYMSICTVDDIKDVITNNKLAQYVTTSIKNQYHWNNTTYKNQSCKTRHPERQTTLYDKLYEIKNIDYNDDIDELMKLIFDYCNSKSKLKYKIFVEYYAAKIHKEEITHAMLSIKYNLTEPVVFQQIRSVTAEIKSIFLNKYNNILN